ncbi:hypothetical protein PVAND_011548 [Polypedilum vanderplanki]|uniref:Uncharacterized protein n=1 Tax=Polypedilum vanderplanki TaxID=319348 RepID=A0A9J6CJK3_POLVA|nr:hypothetical protein PVAND_011548 [Polypedilum vanderplanki]
MKAAARITKKVLEFLGCLACLGVKFWTDVEARRVFYIRQKYSREWSLLHNIFWNTKGDAFAWITYGGYSIITLLFGISICIDPKSRPIYAEKIFLFIGSLMFFGVAALVLASIDQVPDDLIDNAIILGVLSLLVAFLFLIDMSEKMGGRGKSDATQTDTSSIDRHFTRTQNIGTINSQVNLMDHDANDRKSSHNQSIRSKNSEFINIQQNPMTLTVNNDHQMSDFQHQKQSASSTSDYHEDNHSSFISEDIVQSKTYPTPQVATKIKQYPTIVNHLETEPYRKILNKSQQQSSYTRYHDQSQTHHENPTFYDDFAKYRQESYYPAPKIDSGKLMVIRDYSNERHICNCQLQHDSETQDDNLTIKSGYVSQVAKLWDDRTKNSGEFSSLKISPKNTHV